MGTAIGIMDGDSWDHRTDNIVVVNAAKKSVLWIPRDLYCECIQHRINEAYRRGGPNKLKEALAEHHMSVSNVVCIRRDAISEFLKDLKVTVPIKTSFNFWYPIKPTMKIEDHGAKLVKFDPPKETLVGERIHQWLGGRTTSLVKERGSDVDDIDRIKRQHIFIKELLKAGTDFSSILASKDRITITGSIDEIKRINQSWHFDCMTDITPATINGHWVFVRNDLKNKYREFLI